MSFIAIEELYNTSKFLINILYIKKIRSVLKKKSNPENNPYEVVKSLLNRMNIKSRYIKRLNNYLLLRINYDQKKYKLFIDEYVKNTDIELKNNLTVQYISCLLSVGENQKARKIFKKWYLSPSIRISKLESLLSKKKLKILFSKFSTDDWIESFVFFVNEGKQGVIKKLSNYTKATQISALFNAEYDYTKKRYSRARRTLKRVTDKKLSGFKKRILYKIRLRRDKYDLVLSQADELSLYPKAYNGFLLNAAKLSMIERPDLSKLLFEKYIAFDKTITGEKEKSEIEISEYSGAMWRLAWLYYRNGEINKTKQLLKDVSHSPFLSYKLSSEYWIAELEERNSKVFNKYPFNYYYVIQQKRKKEVIKHIPSSFQNLFPVSKTKRLDEIVNNVKILLKYGLIIDCEKYIKEELKNTLLNITEKNYLKFIPLIVAVKEKKYGKSIWNYGRSFTNYREIQLPDYLKEIVVPINYGEIIDKYSKIKKVDPFLIMALIKQESTFKASVVSPSRAYGLMQLLLNTANLMARKYKRRVYRTNLFNPEINIKFGVEYLKDLIDKYNGNIYYALAAYNAGDHRVDKWLPQMGNVTNEEFVEMIPFKETRNYVKLVIRNYYYYKFYYDKEYSLPKKNQKKILEK